MFPIRPLTTADSSALESFACAVYRQDHTQAVEQMVREYLPWNLANDLAVAIGMWDGDSLIGVAAWSVQQESPLIWRCNVVAVASGRHGHKLGIDLKQAVIDHARVSGCLLVTSLIHRDNEAMIGLNEKHLNARVELDPHDPYKNTMICTITV